VAVVLDSNAVIGFLDGGDALHSAADEAVRESVRTRPLLASVVTYAEVLAGARLGHGFEPQVKGFFTDLISELLPVDTEIADRAAALRAQARSLRLPDALILATADLDSRVELVVSGDAVLGKVKGLACEVRLLR
jgi:predicted nucleic acid-binding protein